jgi:toxin ParE1/3/4
MGYRLTRKAADDLHQIYLEGMRLFGAEQAALYHARLRQTFEILSANPLIARERLEINPPVRIHPCGSHVVVYVTEDQGSILIVRVRHGREDWATSP